MDLKTAENALRDMGPICLSMYRKRVKAGHDGLPVGKVQNSLNHLASTLSQQSLNYSLRLVSPEWQSRTLASCAADGLSDRRMLFRQQLRPVACDDSQRDRVVNNRHIL